jgi:hypothetical protein
MSLGLNTLFNPEEASKTAKVSLHAMNTGLRWRLRELGTLDIKRAFNGRASGTRLRKIGSKS